MRVSKEVAKGYSIEAAKKERHAAQEETKPQLWMLAARAWNNVVNSAPDYDVTEYALRRYCFCVKRLEVLEAWDELCILGEI